MLYFRKSCGRFSIACTILLAQSASASHLMYVPDKQWIEQAWQCEKRAISLIEVGSVRNPTTFKADLKVIELKVDGRMVRSSLVAGLDDFVASLDAVHTISGYCGDAGESVSISGFIHGRSDPKATERREFWLPYAR